jgi:general secretion pathway protein I
MRFKSKILNPKSKTRGFTLIEMVVATVLLALGVVGTLACISSATRSTSISSEYTTAALLAQQKISELQAQPEQVQGGEQTGDFGEEYPNFSWQLQVDSGVIASLFRATLIVEWRSGTRARRAQFVTYLLSPPEQLQ